MKRRFALLLAGGALVAVAVLFFLLKRGRAVSTIAPLPAADSGPHPPAPPENPLAAGLRCAEHPPTCSEGPCPPFTRDALIAALDRTVDDRAHLLRAWLCASPAAVESLIEAARVLRAALPMYSCGRPAPAPRLLPQVESRIAPALAQRLICHLPWSSLMGGEQAVLERIGCPECPGFCQEGECSDACFPCEDKDAEGVCLLGYAQGLHDFDGLLDDVPAAAEQCLEDAQAANAPIQAQTAEWDKADARRTVAKSRASLPLDADRWRELTAASVLLDYGRDRRRGPYSLLPAEPAPVDERALRERIRPLFAGVRPPPDDFFAKIVEAPLRTLSSAAGTIVVVCDSSPPYDWAWRKGLFWVSAERIVTIDAPHFEEREGEETEPGRTLETPCTDPIDIADLDGDGKPELILARSLSTVEVITMADTPIRRGQASR
jgi:hypothetical protein